MKDVLMWIGVLVLVGFGLWLRAAQKEHEDDAHSRGMRTETDKRCMYCGKRLKFRSGGSALVDKKRVSRCSGCGADQPIYYGE